MATPPANHCVMCDNTGTLRCTRCQTAYCSLGCQSSDWDKHTYLCREAQNFLDQNRPQPNGPNTIWRRSIWFDPASTRPKFRWV
ncbi:hypothetical protein EJ02DRAFT_453389 [Clathrospora elynae]|uniref:MYND-type domain-containing protein n=1 Tax=Clathrospora elynae TaxID=706981 RepID=A0A6A5ST28_9PLEO|nr:hypothetical protein EJ02DRAFT_453389 [Clathrospora elynae]